MSLFNASASTGTSSTFSIIGDLVSQSPAANNSVVNVRAQIYCGNSATFVGNNAAISVGPYGGTISWPKGVATRTFVSVSPTYGHDAAGNMAAVGMAGAMGNTGTSGMGGPTSIGTQYFAAPRIPKPPSKPGTPIASNVYPTSLQLDWTASADNRGSAIDKYLLRRWDGPLPTGTYTDISETNTLTRVDTTVSPGTQYTYAVFAHNGSYDGYSLVSDPVTVSTLAPMWVKVTGVWTYAVPYVKITGVWTMVQAWVKVAGVWTQTG